jgi:hypothetical protein
MEDIEIKVTKSRGNVYHVPLKQWRRWGSGARQVFNEVYSSMVRNQDLFCHPEHQPVSKRLWKTTAWNAAWIAASAAHDVAA